MSLIGHWGMNDDLANFTVVDSTLTANDGSCSIQTSTVSEAGLTNLLRCFNLSGRLVQVPDHVAYDVTDALSIFIWVKLDVVSGYQPIVGKYASATNQREWLISLQDGVPVVSIGVAGGASATTETADTAVVPAATWVNIGFTYDAGTVKIHVNAAPVDSTSSAPHAAVINNEAVAISVSQIDVTDTAVRVDDLRMNDTKLTQSEINGIYNGGEGTEDPDPGPDPGIQVLLNAENPVDWTSWPKHDAQWSLVDGNFVITYIDGASSFIGQDVGALLDEEYVLEYKISESSHDGELLLSTASSFGSTVLDMTVGVHSVELTVVNASPSYDFYCAITGGTAGTITIDYFRLFKIVEGGGLFGAADEVMFESWGW